MFFSYWINRLDSEKNLLTYKETSLKEEEKKKIEKAKEFIKSDKSDTILGCAVLIVVLVLVVWFVIWLLD